MTKSGIKDYSDLAGYALGRAGASLRRNDPWAMVYWKKTEEFARSMSSDPIPTDFSGWMRGIRTCLQCLRVHLKSGDPVEAALWSSRAKWPVIRARNNGIVMNPRLTGVSPAVFRSEVA